MPVRLFATVILVRMLQKALLALAALGTQLLLTSGTMAASEPPHWIWNARERRPAQSVCLMQEVTLDAPPRRAELVVLADFCRSVVYVNGEPVGRGEPYGPIVRVDIAGRLERGKNVVGIVCQSSASGPAAALVRLEMQSADGEPQTVRSGDDWQAAELRDGAPLTWPDTEKLAWRRAESLGAVGERFWGLGKDTIAISPVDDYEQWRQASDAKSGTDPATFQVAEGFQVELLRTAAEGEDSWVSLASDPRGRWIIGLEKQGLLRLTLAQGDDQPLRVERINDTLHECRGLVFAHNWLYAAANNDKALFRLRDADNDDQFEQIEKLVEFSGDVGHGRNQLALGPDGNVYGIFGDSVFEPEGVKSLPPKLANPTRAEQARSGFVARFNADASQMTVIARGLRNPYGLDFNAHGDLFTYDADAEYDMGASWYRPTRILHLISGGDYGWRRVTKEWPPYFPDRADMPQPLLDIGKGSPTAVKFASGKQFPPRFREALFVLDWAYGRILAVHLTPRGASYQASAESFLRGRPLNVTDLEFGRDGAMYFITGGRGTRSALYRVKYAGKEQPAPTPTVQQQARAAHAAQARATRRQLHSLLGAADASSLDKAWASLGSDDPWIRHAARSLVESIPFDQWRQRAQQETDIDRKLAARIAQSRAVGDDACAEIPLRAASERQLLESLFLVERSLARGNCAATSSKEMREAMRELYPHEEPSANRQLSRLLAEHADETFVARTLPLLAAASDQRDRFHYLYVLRSITEGWNETARQTYFEQLRGMDDFVGGEGMPEFRRLLREQAIAALPEGQRAAYQQMLRQTSAPPWREEMESLAEEKREVVRRWTINDVDNLLAQQEGERDLERGAKMFAAARCVACHRVGERGGVSGPDLTSLAQRFSPRDILVSIVEPSRVIAEQYTADTLELSDGRVLTGRLVPGDYRSTQLQIVPSLLEPEKVVSVAKAEIAARHVAAVSPMPTGLIDVLTREEIADLLAYLAAAGRIAPSPRRP
jgi:putative heme-binding domain-containing protein